jgi:uncharacterized protein (DUF3084 family)
MAATATSSARNFTCLITAARSRAWRPAERRAGAAELLGGMGNFRRATGEVPGDPIGVNRSGLFNIRHTCKIKTNCLT